MNIMIRTMLGLGLVALIAAPASAQGGRGFGRGGNYATLLGNASVQKELGLDDKQVEKAKELADKTREEMQGKFQDLQGLDQAERRTKMQEINREVNASTIKAAGEFLKGEQIARLKQVHRQVQGVMAFNDPEVAQKLNLTDAQKNDIRAIEEAAREKRPSQEDFQSDREAAMKKVQEINKESLAQVTAKLNDEQQKTWKELIGAPFEIKYEPRNN